MNIQSIFINNRKKIDNSMDSDLRGSMNVRLRLTDKGPACV
jgi:hypothetical protein